MLTSTESRHPCLVPILVSCLIPCLVAFSLFPEICGPQISIKLAMIFHGFFFFIILEMLSSTPKSLKTFLMTGIKFSQILFLHLLR